MEIVPLQKEYLPSAAALFVQNFKRLRQQAPVLPDLMEDVGRVVEKLDSRPGLVALERGELVGYMGWFLVDRFRETERKGAYCPEWGHAAAEGMGPQVYRVLYRAAASWWVESGCQLHAFTLLAGDPAVEKFWFWNGFGLAVVDAVRSLAPLNVSAPNGFLVRKASPADAGVLSILDAEHWNHYAQPPVLMVPQASSDAAAFADFLSKPPNSIWLAVQGHTPVGFMKFERSSTGASDIVRAETAIAITGAYVRSEYRGRGVATALLDAGFRDYAARGFECCSVDFESFNPEAAAFWMNYFEPVCLSVMRVPEG